MCEENGVFFFLASRNPQASLLGGFLLLFFHGICYVKNFLLRSCFSWSVDFLYNLLESLKFKVSAAKSVTFWLSKIIQILDSIIPIYLLAIFNLAEGQHLENLHIPLHKFSNFHILTKPFFSNSY